MHVQALKTTGHHRHRANKAALAAHLHAVAVGDAFRLRQRLADLHKLFRLRDGVKPRVLGPGVEMLGQAIGRPYVRELVLFA